MSGVSPRSARGPVLGWVDWRRGGALVGVSPRSVRGRCTAGWTWGEEGLFVVLLDALPLGVPQPAQWLKTVPNALPSLGPGAA